MPFCPKCRYEYREGIDKCPDCDAKLVPKLHEKPHEDHIDSELVLAARFMVVTEAELAKLKLASQGIESVITGETTRMYVTAAFMDSGINLMVRAEDAARARKILEEE